MSDLQVEFKYAHLLQGRLLKPAEVRFKRQLELLLPLDVPELRQRFNDPRSFCAGAANLGAHREGAFCRLISEFAELRFRNLRQHPNFGGRWIGDSDSLSGAESAEMQRRKSGWCDGATAPSSRSNQ
jgi:hypothetical protein